MKTIRESEVGFLKIRSVTLNIIDIAKCGPMGVTMPKSV